MAFDASSRKVLLLHDGELAELRGLVAKIGAQIAELRVGTPAPADWDVAVATPKHLHQLARASTQSRAVRIAVFDRDARTLRAACRRAGVDLVVRQPVHPAALHLLVLHALYRGPERRVRRVPVGAPVRFRAGLRTRSAVLADLSARGCRLLGCEPVPVRRRVAVSLPDPMAAGRSFTVSGRVVRAVRGEGSNRGFAIEFEAVSDRNAQRLKDVVAAHAAGPAAFRGRDALLAPPARSRRAAPEFGRRAAASEETHAASEAAGKAGARASESEDDVVADVDPADRRRGLRRAFHDRRVVALGDEAARVLIGYDLSLGGMRVAPNPSLQLGQHFRVALHGGTGEAPLVVQAEVARDDGERGLVLGFAELTEASRRYLGKVLDSLPVVEACREAAEALVVSEIVDAESL